MIVSSSRYKTNHRLPSSLQRRIAGLAACQFAIDLENIQQGRVVKGVENVGIRTPSDPIETGRCGKRPSDITACQFARHLEIYSNVEYSERDGKCRQMASFGSDGDGLPWQHLLTLIIYLNLNFH